MSRLDELIEELCPDGVEYVELNEVLDYEQPTKYIVRSTNYGDSYTIPVLTAGQSFILGYTNEDFGIYQATPENPVIIFDDFTTSFHWVDFGFKVKSSAMKILKPKNKEFANFRFLFHIMKNINYIPADHARQWIEKYSKFVIPLPPMPVQQEIVRILDNFAEITKELTAVLKTEIEARKKQYECYRDRLLSQEELNKLCPDGVEYKYLWEVTIWDKKFNAVERYKQKKVYTYPYMLASNLFELEKEEGNVYLLSTGEKTGWTTEDLAGNNLCEGEVVTIPWGKSRPVKDVIKYYKGKFVTADNRIVTSADTKILSNKYLYYWLLSQGEVIDTFYRGSGIKHPSMKDVLDMQIPLPPLPIQQEIVRILDNFTESTAELTAKLETELEARQKQYEYYRDKLLSFKEVSS